jgi:hypothetical protein
MSVTLTQQQYLTNDYLQKGVIQTFTENSAVLKYLPFLTINANSYVYNKENALPGAAFRAVNSNYDENAGTVSQDTETLKILGGSVDIDRYLSLTQNVNDIKALQTSMLAKSVALDFDKAFFTGEKDSTAIEFDGLENRITGTQATDVSATLTLDHLDALIDNVRGEPDVIFCHKDVIRKANNLARAAGQAFEYIDGGFGRLIPMYGGIPFVAVETDSNGDDILKSDDSVAAYDIYGVKMGPDKVIGLQATPMTVIDHGLYSGGSLERVTIEWIVSFIVGESKAAARLYEVTL